MNASASEQMGAEIARHTADRMMKALSDGIAACETDQQKLTVTVLTFVHMTGASCGALAGLMGIPADQMDAEEVFPMLMQLSREAKAGTAGDGSAA